MVKFKVYKGSESGDIVESMTKRDVLPDEVLIKVTHSGVCGTDVHWKTTDMALGHEAAGVVESVGSGVTRFKKSAPAQVAGMHTLTLV